MDTIPCLSLWQPWATLMAVGAKLNETRDWPTRYSGPLAIHAAQRWTREMDEMCWREPFRATLEKLRPNEGGTFYFDDLLPKVTPRGAIIAVVRLIDCVEITKHNQPEGNELAFGDYAPGRFMWRTRDARKLAEPVPYVGRQRLFRIPRSLVAVELAALERAA